MNIQCANCDKDFKVKPYRVKRLKNKNNICCSKLCSNVLKSQYMSGENNHQFGLIGDKNSSFKGKEIVNNYGYILEYFPNHPFPADRGNQGTRVRQHRLVIERNYKLFDINYFININGYIALKPEYDVHHIDGNKTNNHINNLQIISRSNHTKLHNLNKNIIRDLSDGRIIGVIKSGELMETPEVDNHEPS